MLFTTEMLYIVTTVKKGTSSALGGFGDEANISTWYLAKHLESLKGGKVPIEILVRGKDADQNAKHFKRCIDAIKDAGVRYGDCLKHGFC